MNSATATGPSPRPPRGPRALEHITLHPQLDHLATQPFQLGPLVRIQGAVLLPGPPLPGAPVAQRALVDAQIPGHLRDRLTGINDQLHRALLEVLIELPILLAHRPLPPQRAMSPRYEGKPTDRLGRGREKGAGEKKHD